MTPSADHIQATVRAYLERVLNELPLGVMVLDRDLRVTFVNRHQTELFERLGLPYSLCDVIGELAADAYPIVSHVEWATAAATVIGSAEPIQHERLRCASGDRDVVLRVAVMPLSELSGTIAGAVCVTEDVTRMEELEQELVRHERVLVAAQMTATLNHEINNPLTTIVGTTEVLLYRQDLDEKTLERLEAIRRSALRLSDVTKRLLALDDIKVRGGSQDEPPMVELAPIGPTLGHGSS